MHLSRGLGLCALAAILSLWGCSPGGDTSRTFDATGAWSGTYAAAGSSGHTFTAQVVQNGTSLSGTISIPLIGMSGAALSGAVDGDSIQFGDIARTISFSGTAQADDTASGTYSISYGGAALSGAWSGTCVRTLFLVKTVSIPGGVGSGVGLAWDGSRMWVSATQQLAALSADGALLASYSYNDLQFPYHDFQSLAFDGSSVWAVEDGEQPPYTQAVLFALSPSDGSIVSSIPAPPDGTATNVGGDIGLGLGWDGSTLWCLRNPQSGTQTIYRIARATGAVQGSIPVPANSYGSAMMVGGFGAGDGYLWVSDRLGYVECLRPSDGHLLRRFDFSTSAGSGATPAGIAWDGSHLWVRDLYAASLYCFTVPAGVMP